MELILLDMTIVMIASVAAFLTVILFLVVLLMYAKAKLMPSGDVSILVNGDESKLITTSPGGNLLFTLADQEIYLGSACGGGGTCALCKCQVMEGGGDVLPTELNYLTRKEAQDHWRLACQVKIRQDMKIAVPEEVFGVEKWECEVVSNENVATFIKELIVKLPSGKNLSFESGGYIQIYIPEYELDFSKDIDIPDEYKPDWDNSNMWDLKVTNDEEIFRAYSMANHPAEGDVIKLDIRIASPPWDAKKKKFKNIPPGLATSYLFAMKAGDKVDISGSYGEFFIKDTEKEMIYIGGGAGMAPLRSHVFHLFDTLKTKRKVTYWYGGRSLRELFYTDEFREIEKNNTNFTYKLALSEALPEDNWTGPTGFIHQAVYDNFLKDHPEPEEAEYYLCGPPQMLEAVFGMLDSIGVPRDNVAFDEF